MDEEVNRDSCTEQTHFTIKGLVDQSFYGNEIYLCNLAEADTIAVGHFHDSTSFSIEGEVTEATPVYLTSSSSQTTTPFVLEKGKMKLKEVHDSLFLVMGTPLNEELSRFLLDYEGAPDDSLITGMEELMLDHSSDALGTLLGRSVGYAVEAQEYLDLYNKMDIYMRDDPFFINLYKKYSRSVVAIGSMFSEVIGEVNGKPARLSDYAGRGSWILLSFWASWCGDCAREMPKLRKLYDTLKEEQINVIGISSRDQFESMQRAIKRYDIVWPVFFNADGLNTLAYGIVTIPSLVLIDPDGVVVATGTTSEDFLEKIQKAKSLYQAQ